MSLVYKYSTYQETHLEIRLNLIFIYPAKPRFGQTETTMSKTEQFGQTIASVPNLKEIVYSYYSYKDIFQNHVFGVQI